MVQAPPHGYKDVRNVYSIHEGHFMSDSSFVVKFVLTKTKIIAAKQHETTKGGSAAFVWASWGTVLINLLQ